MTNIVARFTHYSDAVTYPRRRRRSALDRTLGTHDGSARGQGACAGGDRRTIKDVLRKRNRYLYVALSGVFKLKCM